METHRLGCSSRCPVSGEGRGQESVNAVARIAVQETIPSCLQVKKAAGFVSGLALEQITRRCS